MVKLAKRLHCTTDFLLGLTDDPAPRGASDSDTQPADAAPQWRTGTPPENNDYWTQDSHGETELYHWDGTEWRNVYGSCFPVSAIGIKVVRWYPLPDDAYEEDAK